MKKRLLLLAAAATVFALAYGATTMAWPIKGRDPYVGYFFGAYDSAGDYVIRPDSNTAGCPASGGLAVPTYVDSAGEFIGFIECKLNSSNGNGNVRNQERTGAAFIIQTMIGEAKAAPPSGTQMAEWRARVYSAEAAGQITWNTNWNFTTNSFFQGNPVQGNSSPNDDAFYNGSGSGAAIVFGGGADVYVLRRQCANPVGNGTIGELPPASNYDMTGRSTVDNASPLPGQTIRFNHYIRNEGPDSTGSTVIWWGSRDSNSGAIVVWGNPAGTFAAGQEKGFADPPYTVPAGTPAGTQICRQVYYVPGGNDSGDESGPEVCATVRYDFSLTPIINFTVNGAAPTGSIAEQGDSITFNYAVNNSGLTQSMLASCNIYGLARTGSYTAPTPPDSASDPGYVPPPTGCPRTFPYDSTTAVTSETITATTVNQTICRALWINPASLTVGARGTESCIRIVAKPYLKVYGGDVAAGSGLETAPDTCTSNTDASITSWNKRDTGVPAADHNYAGAGVQYAGFALRAITDFATGRDNSVGATNPAWLSFANSVGVNGPSGQYGGTFGSVPCIRDYYGLRPTTTLALPPNVSAMGTGIYGGSGSVNLTGGNVNPGENMTVYIDGNVFIDSNITYTPNWSYNNTPLFQLVVRGNIYISSAVTQLDGVYIAQRNGASGGTIYTCATAAAAPVLTNGAFFNACNSKLTINGAFMADSVEFLRTSGSLSQSRVNEPSAGSTAGEVFNFNPSLWMVQPLQGSGGADSYDAITSLPPVL